ncbi:RNase H family protein [Apilactobacillus xinyiensis]|uniref:Reverse transcriptase-like protein n=1 Tax=Apilactobacillus xinyiensis TaxID=2841032 RepID=A0ABT0HZX2_9LACO|nr:RNase H family protein [Apilactobacillus xinyiensis]MCK8624123.1 reverse transcriptase-like protein [Apilactobacillus xinyiensis]MCL0318141.1 reverse transcriptase-like protein [Apilactobacillus xinyiensis]
MIKLYTDAATMNLSGKSAAGILIIKNGKQQQIKLPLESKDNHLAEFEACKLGFELVYNQYTDETSQEIICYYTDSKIVYQSLEKNYAKHYQAQVDAIKKYQISYQLVINNWISDKKNEGAHKLAQQALHKFY